MPGYIAPIFFITGFFDILGSSLAAIGLVYIDASVWMMFRGSMIIFAGETPLLKALVVETCATIEDRVFLISVRAHFSFEEKLSKNGLIGSTFSIINSVIDNPVPCSLFNSIQFKYISS